MYWATLPGGSIISGPSSPSNSGGFPALNIQVILKFSGYQDVYKPVLYPDGYVNEKRLIFYAPVAKINESLRETMVC